MPMRPLLARLRLGLGSNPNPSPNPNPNPNQARLLDGSRLREFKPGYGASLICGLGLGLGLGLRLGSG